MPRKVWQKRSSLIVDFLEKAPGANTVSQDLGLNVEAETSLLGWAPTSIAAMRALMSYFCPGSEERTAIEYRDRTPRLRSFKKFGFFFVV